MFTEVFTIAQIYKQPKCPSIDECIKKMWYDEREDRERERGREGGREEDTASRMWQPGAGVGSELGVLL
jgi:hypothetical protein